MVTVLDRLVYRKKRQTEFRNELEIIRSEIEYNEKTKNLNYLIFELERYDANGQKIRLFKALRFMRLIRVPKNQDISLKLMEKQSEILSALWENKINFITMVANIIDSKPHPIGLLYCYGVQGVSYTIDEAKTECDIAYRALADAIKGSYKTMEFRALNHQEVEWLRVKMYEMNNISMVRGIPSPAKATVKNQIIPIDPVSGKMNPLDNETMEEFVIGMSDHEYIYMCVCTPIEQSTLVNWSKLSAREATDWRKIMNQSMNVSFNVSLPLTFGGNIGSNQGWGEAYSVTDSVGHADSMTHTTGFSDGVSHTSTLGTADGTSQGTTVGTSDGTTNGVTNTHGTAHSTNHSTSHGTSTGTTESTSVSDTKTTSNGTTTTHTNSSGTSSTTSRNVTSSDGTSASKGTSSSSTDGTSTGTSDTHSDGTSSTHTKTSSNTAGGSISVSEKLGFLGTGVSSTQTGSYSHSWGSSDADGTTSSNAHGVTSGENHSTSSGTNSSSGSSHSDSVGTGYSGGTNKSVSDATGKTSSVSNAHGTTTSKGTTSTISDSVTDGVSDTVSDSTAISQSSSHTDSQSLSKGTSSTLSKSEAQGTTHSTTVSNAKGSTESTSKSTGNTANISSAVTQAQSGSMGLMQGLSISKGYNWVDTRVEDIVKMIMFQHERVIKATNGQGAFYVDTFLATKDELADSSARSLSKSAFGYKDSYTQPLQAIKPDKLEQVKLLNHMIAFSPSLETEGIAGQLESYKWSTMLLPDELSSMTHPCRVSEGGLYADVEDMPKLAVPSDRQYGEVYVGTVVSAERYSEETGYLTRFKYAIDTDELMHAIFQAESRSGKTVTAERVIVEFSKIRRKATNKRLRIVVFDQKKDWRNIAKFVDQDRFVFYTLEEINDLTLYVNLLIIPPNVTPEKWINLLAENFVLHYKMNVKGKQIITKALFEVYRKEGCLERDWKQVATEKSRNCRISHVYKEVEKIMNEKKAQKVGFNEIDAYERVLQRLDDFNNPYTIAYQIFNEGIGIHEFLGDDDITVLEAKGLKAEVKNFVFGVMFCGIYEYAIANGTFMSRNQYETICVVEEANDVLIGQGVTAEDGAEQSIFETIIDQSAGNGFYCFAITQKVMSMPLSLRVNAGINFFGRTRDSDTMAWLTQSLGRNPRYNDRELANWFARMPDLYMVAKIGRVDDFKKSEPCHVFVDMLPIPRQDEDRIQNEELLNMKKLRDSKRIS